MDATKSFKLFIVFVMCSAIGSKAIFLCRQCQSKPGKINPDCLRKTISDAKPCGTGENYCTIKYIFDKNNLSNKTSTIIRGCARNNGSNQCQTDSNNVTTCTRTCSTRFCNNRLPRPVPTFDPNESTTVASPAIPPNRCYVCSSNGGNNPACENSISSSSNSISVELCPADKPYCSTEVYILKAFPMISGSLRIQRGCRKSLQPVNRDCYKKNAAISVCISPCVGDRCNNIDPSPLYLN